MFVSGESAKITERYELIRLWKSIGGMTFDEFMDQDYKFIEELLDIEKAESFGRALQKSNLESQSNK